MEAGARVTASRHRLHAQRYRNERKRILFEKWLSLGMVQVNFDATHVEVALPLKHKADPDFWVAVVEAEVYTSHFEGTCKPPGRAEFQFQIPWDSVHALYSTAIHERHIWLEDVSRAAKREEIRKMVKTGRPLPS
jgi:hypothetical protein